MDTDVMAAARIEVACSADPRYGPHCAAMLHSLFTQQEPGTVRVHFLHGPTLPGAMKRRLTSLAARHAGEIRFHEIADKAVRGLPAVARIPALMWYRTLLPDLLPELHRVLYLDADTLVNDALHELWNTDLDGRYIGAVTNVMDPMHRDWPGTLGIRERGAYFNSGVLLMNLSAMRRDGCAQELVAYGRRTRQRLLFPDQDALNVVLGARRHSLHPRWNCMNSFSFYPDSADYFRAGELAEALERPGILHFEGPDVVKPWHFGNRSPRRSLYYHHLRGSRWPVRLPEGITLRALAKRYLPESARKPLRRMADWLKPGGGLRK